MKRGEEGIVDEVSRGQEQARLAQRGLGLVKYRECWLPDSPSRPGESPRVRERHLEFAPHQEAMAVEVKLNQLRRFSGVKIKNSSSAAEAFKETVDGIHFLDLEKI